MNQNSFYVHASILDAPNFLGAIEKLLKIGVRVIHYDVMDGIFVKRNILPIDQIKNLIAHSLPHYVDVHLMVNDVLKYCHEVSSFANQISIHYEALKDLNLLDKIINDYPQLKIGIGLNPGTDWNLIKRFLPKLNHVLLMSVVPGKGGQKFEEKVWTKIKTLKNYFQQQKLKTLIQVDGGINDLYGPQLVKLGVNQIVVGSYLLKNLSKQTLAKIEGKHEI